mmetsp:Transcript_4510/g.12977  ORF Transcript_4510/g.12977 Transcript_4510/m.12977 type:complete len:406 (-) Transcript_4510:260-1477(-)
MHCHPNNQQQQLPCHHHPHLHLHQQQHVKNEQRMHDGDDDDGAGPPPSCGHHLNPQQHQIHSVVEYLTSLIGDLRHQHNTASKYASGAIRITLVKFCNAMASITKGRTFSVRQFQELLEYLDSEQHAMQVIVGILRSPHRNIDTCKWGLAALVWFLHGSQQRATKAVASGAIQIIVGIMRQCRGCATSDSTIKRRQEMLQCAAMSVLIQLIRHSDAATLKAFCIHAHAHVHGERAVVQEQQVHHHHDTHAHGSYGDANATVVATPCNRGTTTSSSSPTFLVEDILDVMEMHAPSLRVYKSGCILLGALHILVRDAMVNDGTASTLPPSSHALYSAAAAAATARWHSIQHRMVECLYQNGLLNHGMWDEGAKNLSRSLLNLVLEHPALVEAVLRHADSQNCHGGAA